MTSNHKHPSAAFWATVAVVVTLIAYALSIGPTIWLRHQAWAKWIWPSYGALSYVYYPIFWMRENGPRPIHDLINWYFELWR